MIFFACFSLLNIDFEVLNMSVGELRPDKPAAGKQASFRVTGMTCAACSARVDRKSNATEGIASAAMNLTTGRAVAEYNPQMISPAKLPAS